MPNLVSLMPLDYGFTLSILRGLRRFVTSDRGWSLWVGNPGQIRTVHRIRPRPDCFIALVTDTEQAESLQALPQPVVDVSSRGEGRGLPCVRQDDEAVGGIAARHLLEKGFERFACCGASAGYWSGREAGFRAQVESHGFDVRNLGMTYGDLSGNIGRLEPPVGVFAANDCVGSQVIELCLGLGLRVPEDVAVIGVDNDEAICEAAAVPLSSVDNAAETIGFQAGRMAARLLSGDAAPDEQVTVPPRSVVPRASTDVVGVDDPALARALAYIHQHACDPMRIDDLMNEQTVSRRTLETRFKRRFGRTLAEEIRRVRLDRAKHLLDETDLPVADVMYACGYADIPRFIAWFRKEAGLPPAAYRRRNRGLT